MPYNRAKTSKKKLRLWHASCQHNQDYWNFFFPSLPAHFNFDFSLGLQWLPRSFGFHFMHDLSTRCSFFFILHLGKRVGGIGNANREPKEFIELIRFSEVMGRVVHMLACLNRILSKCCCSLPLRGANFSYCLQAYNVVLWKTISRLQIELRSKFFFVYLHLASRAHSGNGHSVRWRNMHSRETSSRHSVEGN